MCTCKSALLSCFTLAFMAEWSKALDLRSTVRQGAWVRTPLDAFGDSFFAIFKKWLCSFCTHSFWYLCFANQNHVAVVVLALCNGNSLSTEQSVVVPICYLIFLEVYVLLLIHRMQPRQQIANDLVGFNPFYLIVLKSA